MFQILILIYYSLCHENVWRDRGQEKKNTIYNNTEDLFKKN